MIFLNLSILIQVYIAIFAIRVTSRNFILGMTILGVDIFEN